VVMQLLLGLDVSDILYFATNNRTQWQWSRVGKGDFVCRKNFDWKQDVLPEMAEKEIELPNGGTGTTNTTINTGAVNNQTTSLSSSFSIEEYLEQDPEWFAQNYADYVFYQAATQSLDRTILKIGLDRYAKALKDFRRLLQQARHQCRPKFVCSDDGRDQLELSQADCFANEANIGCASECLNNLKPSSINQAQNQQEEQPQ
jgi:hypothetical protein